MAGEGGVHCGGHLHTPTHPQRKGREGGTETGERGERREGGQRGEESGGREERGGDREGRGKERELDKCHGNQLWVLGYIAM